MTVRLAVIGCGAAARRLHLPGFRAAGAAVTAFASRTRASAEAAAAEWGSGDVQDDWRAAVGRDDVDAVAVCTPNALHAPVAIAAAEAGKHVLVEKPMGRTVAEAAAMMDAARSAGVILVPAHNARFAPPVAAARAVVASGRLGRITGFRIRFAHPGPKAWSADASWFTDPEVAGGGALLDLGVHAADVARFVLGEDIAEVAALCGPVAPAGVEEEAVVVARTASGAIGTLHVSWREVAGTDHALSLSGSEGSFQFDVRTPPVIRTAAGEEAVPLPEPVPEPYAGFVHAVEGAEPPVTAADGLAAVAVVEAAYRSARSGSRAAVEGV
jgi:predicted dehydrogenase